MNSCVSSEGSLKNTKTIAKWLYWLCCKYVQHRLARIKSYLRMCSRGRLTQCVKNRPRETSSTRTRVPRVHEPCSRDSGLSRETDSKCPSVELRPLSCYPAPALIPSTRGEGDTSSCMNDKVEIQAIKCQIRDNSEMSNKRIATKGKLMMIIIRTQ